MSRRNLVIVPAGDASLHSRWLEAAGERSWDLVVVAYGSRPELHVRDGIRVLPRKGMKFQLLDWALGSGEIDLAGYERIWLPDDDIDADAGTIERFFSICAENHLGLAQPALDRESYVSHPITAVSPGYLLRWTNFVEVMAPCFDRETLRACLPTFGRSVSGWGLDYLWPTLVRGTRSIGIVDAAPVRHTRPVGGPSYGVLRQLGVDAGEEKARLVGQLQAPPRIRVSEGLRPDGTIRVFPSRPSFLSALRLMLRGDSQVAVLLRAEMRGTGPRPLSVVVLDWIFHLLGIPGKWSKSPSIQGAGA